MCFFEGEGVNSESFRILIGIQENTHSRPLGQRVRQLGGGSAAPGSLSGSAWFPLCPSESFGFLYGSGWFPLAPSDSVWFPLDPSLVPSLIPSLVPSGSLWLRSLWFALIRSGLLWLPLVPSGSLWFAVVPVGPQWFLVVPVGSHSSRSFLLVSVGVRFRFIFDSGFVFNSVCGSVFIFVFGFVFEVVLQFHVSFHFRRCC